MPSQLSNTIASRYSLGSGEKSSIVPLPPSASIPRLHICVAASDVTNLFALTRMRCQATSSLVGGALVDPGHELRQVHRRCERRRRLRLHHREVLAHEREAGDRAAESLALLGEARRLEIGAPHQPGRAERVQPARGVQDADGDPEAVLDRAERIGRCAVELDLAGRQRPRPELVLQPADREAASGAGNQEAADPARPFGGAPRPRRDDELVGVRDRAEPLLARDPPGVAVRDRLDAVRADVRAAVTLGQELGATLGAVVVRLEQRRQETFAQLVVGVRPQRTDEAGGADDGTGMARLARVRELVEQRRLLARAGADDPRGPHGAARAVVSGVKLDPPVGSEPRRLLLGLRNGRVDHLHHDLAEVAGDGLDHRYRLSVVDLRDGPDEASFRGEVRALARGEPARRRQPRVEPEDLRRRLRGPDLARGVRRQGRALQPPGDRARGVRARRGAAAHGRDRARHGGPDDHGARHEEQKRRYLKKILSAEEIWCQGFSEPGAGSDLSAVGTRIEVTDSHFNVTGQKVWSSFAHIADHCILVGRSDPDSESHAGLTYLIVDMKSPGVEVRPLRQITGEAEFNEIFLTDVKVPRGNLLGEIGGGWQVAMTTLLHERGTLGFALSGVLESQVQKLVALVKERGADDPIIRDRVAQEWIELQALKFTNYRSLTALMKTGIPGPEGSGAKLHWSEQNQRLTKLAEREGREDLD